MKFIPHFSVFCANIGFFCETTKFLGEFLLQAYHQYCVSTIITGSYSYQFFIFVPHCSIALHWSSFESLRLPLAKGSSTSNQAFLLRRKDVTALRCSEPLRYRVGGPIKGLAMLCGMGPPGDGKKYKFFYYSDRYLTIQGFNSGMSTSIVSHRLSGSMV